MKKISRYSYESAPTIARFASDDSFVRMLMGPFGSGKTSGCIMEIIRRAHAMPMHPSGKRLSRWAVVRNTYRQLEDTTIKSFHDWLPPRFYGSWRAQEHNYIIDKLHPEISLEVWFRALDRPDQLQNLLSTEYTGAWINEAREVPKEIFDGLTGRLGRFPRAAEVPNYWSGLIMDTNPPDTDSWLYKLFEEVRPPGFRVFKQPPGDGPDAENIKFLRPDYYQRLATGKSRDWIRVYVKGQYGFADIGRAIYPEYSDAIHTSEETLEPSESHPLYVGLDFGLTPAAVIGQLTSTRWLILDELITDDIMGASRFGAQLRELLASKYRGFQARIWGDPAGAQRAQTDEMTPFAILRNLGISAEPAPTNDFEIRREAVARRLSALSIDGRPQVLISPSCIKLRKALSGGYNYRRIAIAGENRYRDKPDKGPLSHVAEAMQYLFVGAGEGYSVIRYEPDVQEYDEDDDYRGGRASGWMSA